MTVAGRSSVARLAGPVPARDRRWWLRRVIVLAVVVAIFLLARAVSQEMFDPHGPGRLLYLAHDRVWLPFWSLVWVRSGFLSLVWWVPVVIFSAMALMEFLGIGQPVRRLQIGIIRRLMRGRAGWYVLLLQQMLGWKHNREGLLVATLKADFTRESAGLRRAIEAGESRDGVRLGRLMLWLAHLRATDPAIQVRCAEALMLIVRAGGEAAAAPVAARLGRILLPEDSAQLTDAITPDPEAHSERLDDLRRGDLEPVALALTTLAMARAGSLARPRLARAWFVEWARQRHAGSSGSAALVAAEQMIDFEFWAALAESGLAMLELEGDRQGWLGDLLPDVAMRRPLGELAAAGLQESAR